MRNPGKGRLLTFEPSSGNWRKNLGTDIRNGSVKKYPIIGIPFGLRPHSIPIMGTDTVNGILPTDPGNTHFHERIKCIILYLQILIRASHRVRLMAETRDFPQGETGL